MPNLVDLLFLQTWWSWSATDRAWHSHIVHWFNLFEGAVWWWFAGLVALRHFHHRQSRIEIFYAAAFVAFGVTDFVEAYLLTSWLLWCKVLILGALWCLRKSVRQRWYPNSRLY